MPNEFKQRTGELKPREQMERAASPRELAPDVLLAVLLKTGAAGCDVLELARRLLEAFGGLRNLLACDWRRLEARLAQYNELNPARPILGLGHVKCLELAAAFELGSRALRLSPEELRTRTVRRPAEGYAIFRACVPPDETQENFFVLPLDTRFHPLCEPLRIARGTRDGVAVHPRDIFREAIRWNARGIMLAHNHPTGEATPSDEDRDLTRKICSLAEIVGIDLVDHLVLGDPQAARPYVSLRQELKWGQTPG